MKRMRVAATSPVVSLGAAIEQNVRQGRAVVLEACGHPALWRALLGLIYADGFLRCWSGRGALRHGGAVLPLLGRVSMDMVVVDCTTVPELREGDWLDLPYHLPDSAARCDLSQYELLTLLGRRFRRI